VIFTSFVICCLSPGPINGAVLTRRSAANAKESDGSSKSTNLGGEKNRYGNTGYRRQKGWISLPLFNTKLSLLFSLIEIWKSDL